LRWFLKEILARYSFPYVSLSLLTNPLNFNGLILTSAVAFMESNKGSTNTTFKWIIFLHKNMIHLVYFTNFDERVHFDF
jgi:hypothetical protein